jgi:hypothetical protein
LKFFFFTNNSLQITKHDIDTTTSPDDLLNDHGLRFMTFDFQLNHLSNLITQLPLINPSFSSLTLTHPNHHHSPSPTPP